MPSKTVAIFAKAPLPGRVKTRLHSCMTPAEAADLHTAFVADTWVRLAPIEGVTRYLYCDQIWEPFRQLAGSESFRLQQGANLGARMLRCMEELSAAGHDRVLVLGSDSPTLPINYVEQAFAALSESDTVLGPAADGGYYAVGCRQPHPEMFAGVAWSTPDTLRQTESAFRESGLSTTLLPEWYDVDTEAELARLAAENSLPQNTQGWFNRHPHVRDRISRR